MGFYGNITNTSRTQFQFDKIYPNRATMDGQVSLDGIYIGRFVLIEYGEETYQDNYNIDKEVYPDKGRGYDSTVWQKVHLDGEEKYVMIAELNTVVPTFDVTADAPTITPLAPHYDKDSTNIYYKMHIQSPWGFRVKPANNYDVNMINNSTGATIEGTHLLTDTDFEYSDESSKVYRVALKDLEPTTYSLKVGEGEAEWVPEDQGSDIPLAIYYNKDGFNPEMISHTAESLEDKIAITPTGKSGYQYNTVHKTDDPNLNVLTPQVDTQELSILLPSIGNTIASVWDIVYGGGENGETRNTVINWLEDSEEPGLRVFTPIFDEEGNIIELEYHPENARTLAGAINSTIDLLGLPMIKTVNEINSAEDLEEGYIYYNETDKKFYRKGQEINENGEIIDAPITIEFLNEANSSLLGLLLRLLDAVPDLTGLTRNSLVVTDDKGKITVGNLGEVVLMDYPENEEPDNIVKNGETLIDVLKDLENKVNMKPISSEDINNICI